MKNQRLFVILLVTTLVITIAAPLCAAATLSKPNVTLPSNWQQTDETAYPTEISEHDPLGAGLVEYQDTVNYDLVMIYYENAPTISYSSAELIAEVESIFNRDHTDITIIDSGTMTVAGVQAGYAKGYDSAYAVYELELVFVKGNYYINAYALYDANTQSNDKVMSLLNSINTETSFFSGSMLYIIIGIVIALFVVVVVLVMVMRRKKKTATPQIQTYPGSIPPPPV